MWRKTREGGWKAGEETRLSIEVGCKGYCRNLLSTVQLEELFCTRKRAKSRVYERQVIYSCNLYGGALFLRVVLREEDRVCLPQLWLQMELD